MKTYDLEVKRPLWGEKGQNEVAAVLSISTDTASRRERRAGKTKPTVIDLGLTPSAVNKLRKDLEHYEFMWSLVHQPWVIEITKGFKAGEHSFKKGEVVLLPVLGNLPTLLRKNSSKQENKLIDAPFIAFTQNESSWKPIEPTEFANYYNKLDEDVKTMFANHYFVAHNLPIPGLE